MKNNNKPTIYGKVMPSSVELEITVLGTILLYPNSMLKVLALIRNSDVFYVEANRLIFEALRELNESSLIDIITLTNFLRKNGNLSKVGGSYYISKLTYSVVNDTHISEHCRLLLELYFKREIINISHTVMSDGYKDDSDIFDTIEKLKETLYVINDKIEYTKDKEFRVMLNEFTELLLKDVQRLKNNDNVIKTFVPEFDEVLGELQGGNIYVIAARTSMGKTAFEISQSLQQSQKFNVGVWNGELKDTRMLKRYISNSANLTVFQINKDPELHMEKIYNAIEELSANKLHLDNTPNIKIDELCNKIKYWVFAKNCKCIWLDYLQIITLSETQMRQYVQKTERIAYIIDRLNEVSKICQVPIILLAQVNRDALKSGDKRPNLGNLRDSGSIEERVYHVSFLHRPEYYNEHEFEGRSTQNMLQIIVAKNGDGTNNITIEVRHELQFNRVLSMKEVLEPFKFIENDTPF